MLTELQPLELKRLTLHSEHKVTAVSCSFRHPHARPRATEHASMWEGGMDAPIARQTPCTVLVLLSA